MPQAVDRPFGRFARRFLRSTEGGFGIWFGVAFPAVAMLAFAAVEMMEVANDKTRLQNVADAAALMGAGELAMAYSAGVEDRAEGYALTQLGNLTGGATFEAEALAEGARMTVVLTARRMGFFANLLPPGGFVTQVRAIAESGGAQPLCVAALMDSLPNGAQGSVINVTGAARLEASNCMVHSNHDISVAFASYMTAARVQAAGTASGPITPAAFTRVGTMLDPFAGREFPMTSCPPSTQVPVPLTITTNQTVPEGLHCGGIVVDGMVQVRLAPGVHYFDRGHLSIKSLATLTGENVTLVFGPDAKFKFQDLATVRLTGRESGAYAGMLLVASRNNNELFEILSGNVKRLEGVIYLPSSTLRVWGAAAVSAESDWTVTVTRQLKVEGTARLAINTAYSSSTVPVPAGVGPSSSALRLLN